MSNDRIINPAAAQEILQRFVAKVDVRDYMRNPIKMDQFVYATAGKACVRVRDQEGIISTETENLARLERLFANNQRDSWVEFPALPPIAKCQSCGGTGVKYECTDCEGLGEFRHGPHLYDCKSCDGEGCLATGDEDELVCQHCDGTGDDFKAVVLVGAQLFGLHYVAKIAALPGVRFAPSNFDTPAYFTFLGGEGLLMPIRGEA